MKKGEKYIPTCTYIRKDKNKMTNSFMTIDEICNYLNIGKNSAYRLTKNLRHIKIGRKLMVLREDVDKYITDLLNEKQTEKI
jgi:excisionase family DNA binding protein